MKIKTFRYIVIFGSPSDGENNLEPGGKEKENIYSNLTDKRVFIFRVLRELFVTSGLSPAEIWTDLWDRNVKQNCIQNRYVDF